MRIETREQLQAIRKEAKAKIDATPIRILICAGTGCISGGSQFIYEKMKELEKKVKFSFWEKADDTHTVVRFAVSWATQEEMIDELQELL